MDNLRVRKSQEVKKWAEENKDKIKLHYLPPYAPEHNPDEYLNNAVKQRVHHKSGMIQSNSKLKDAARKALLGFQKQPETIKGFFKNQYTKYAA